MFQEDIAIAIFNELPVRTKGKMIRKLINKNEFSSEIVPINQYPRYDALQILPFIDDLSGYYAETMKTKLGSHVEIRSTEGGYPRIDWIKYPNLKSQIFIRTENYPLNKEMYVVEAIMDVPYGYTYTVGGNVVSHWLRDFDLGKWTQI